MAFLNGAGLAKTLGVPVPTLGSWRTRYPDCPAPAAHYVGAGGREHPLWHQGQIPRWREWMLNRKDGRVRDG